MDYFKTFYSSRNRTSLQIITEEFLWPIFFIGNPIISCLLAMFVATIYSSIIMSIYIIYVMVIGCYLIIYFTKFAPSRPEGDNIWTVLFLVCSVLVSLVGFGLFRLFRFGFLLLINTFPIN
eukprot:411215_1